MNSANPNPEIGGINREQFDQLLGWLDADRDLAGHKYESIRKRLVKIFVCRGSRIPEELADTTINRVARKLPEILASYQGDPAHYFLKVANFILLESLKKERVPPKGMPPPSPPDPDEERDYELLQQCIANLTKEDAYLIATYYEQEKHHKIDRRRELAEELGIPMNALRIRACRIRAALMRCVEQLRLRESDEMMKHNRPDGHPQ